MKIQLKRLQPSEFILLSAPAIGVGLASGAVVWLFKWLIDQVEQLAFNQPSGALEPSGEWTVMLLPWKPSRH